MSFFTGIYSKVLGINSKKTEETCSDRTAVSGFTEDYDNEDGFVLYTPDQNNKRYKQTDSNPGAGNYISHEHFQQSSTYPPTASTSHMATTTAAGGRLVEKRSTTFLTVSDLPMKLSRQLQAMLQMDHETADVLRRSPPNIEQYHYDFTLERDVIRSFQSPSVG